MRHVPLQADRLVRGPGQWHRRGRGEDDALRGGRRTELDAGPGRRAGVAVLDPVWMSVRVLASERVKPAAGRAESVGVEGWHRVTSFAAVACAVTRACARPRR